MAALKIIHTSDINLGRRFPNLESEAEKLRADDITRVFNQLIDHTIKTEARLLLIAGNLFDKMHPNRETVSTALTAFGRIHEAMPDARIVLTPGQEEVIVKKGGGTDCALSIFDHLSYVNIIGAGEEPDTVEYEFGGQKVTVSSCQTSFFFDENFKKRRIPAPKESAGIFLLCAFSRRQGLITISDDLLRSNIIEPLRERGYSYVALGHRHRFDAIETGELTAIFPGSLERFNFDEDRERKCFISLTIENGKIQTPETVRTAARPLEYVNLSCSISDKDLGSMLGDLVKRGSKDKILYVALNGQLSFETFNAFQKSGLLKKLRDRFAFVHIENRLVLVDEDAQYNFDALRVASPIEEFKRYMRREIDDARERGGEVTLLEELLEMGLAEIEDGK
jgi:DNA repair protein SbcD/Mre11